MTKTTEQIAFNQQNAVAANFVLFVKRDLARLGMTDIQAYHEFKRITGCAGFAAADDRMQDYFRYDRVGAEVALNRRDRRDVYMTLQAAVNHTLALLA